MSPNYVDLINRGGRGTPEREAIVFQGKSLSFAEVHRATNQLANTLADRGLAHGDRLGLLVNNGLYSVPLDFACAKAGINRVPLNARLSVPEHARMLEDTGCTRLVYGPDLAGAAEALEEAVPGLVCLPLGQEGEGLLGEAAGASEAEPDVKVAADDVVLTLFTSGTTGTLKAAQHTQASYAAICRNVLLNLIDPLPDDTMLHAASLIHASGVFVLPFWLRGARTVIMSQFEPAAYLKAIHAHDVTAINLVPTMLQMLLGHPDFGAVAGSRLKQVIYGASPMPRPVIEQAMSAWGRERFWQYYGQTECPLAVAVLRPEDHEGEALGACGRPALDVEIRLVDEAGKDVAPGETGEIAVRAPSMMAGYHNAPDLNTQMMMGDGWMRTRDLGQFDETGLLYLRDRTSDMIITGGYNVYPREIEDILMAHPAVAECAVVGVQDEKWVEAVTAVVALKPGEIIDGDTLAAFVGERVASYKRPRRVVIVDAIAKTAVGKVNRKAVRDQLQASD